VAGKLAGRENKGECHMANIGIKFSQAVVDMQNSMQPAPGTITNGTIGGLLDAMMVAGNSVNRYYQYYSSWSLVGTTLTYNFPDGATKTYTGMVRADPNATKGTATATGFEFYKDGLLTSASAGMLSFNYELIQSGDSYALSLAPGNTPSTINILKLATLLPATSTAYDPTLGDISILMNGATHTDAANNLSGTLSKVTMTADKYLFSSVIEGNFNLTGNLLTAGQGLTNTSITGNLTNFKDEYRDGSHLYVTDLSTYLNAGQVIDESMLADATRFSGDDTVNIDLPAKLYADVLMASGSGNDNITLKGGGGRLNADGGSGNDLVTIVSDAHHVDGGAGLDTVLFQSSRNNYTVQKTATGYTVKDSTGAVSTLDNVERLKFLDSAVALDISGNAGMAYRVYQAAFDRAPDAAGLGYWIKAMDGGMSLTDVASGFTTSNEFKAMYGANPSHLDFVNKLYLNVLHRPGEAAGVAYWTATLDNPGTTAAAVLAAFSESTENKAALVGVIGNGFDYQPFLG
jgi:hypothetical protein